MEVSFTFSVSYKFPLVSKEIVIEGVALPSLSFEDSLSPSRIHYPLAMLISLSKKGNPKLNCFLREKSVPQTRGNMAYESKSEIFK